MFVLGVEKEFVLGLYPKELMCDDDEENEEENLEDVDDNEEESKVLEESFVTALRKSTSKVINSQLMNA